MINFFNKIRVTSVSIINLLHGITFCFIFFFRTKERKRTLDTIEIGTECLESYFSCQEFSWILDFFPKSVAIILGDWKILRTLPRIIAKILTRILKNPRNLLAGKPKFQALGIYSTLLNIFLAKVILA